MAASRHAADVGQEELALAERAEVVLLALREQLGDRARLRAQACARSLVALVVRVWRTATRDDEHRHERRRCRAGAGGAEL